jgi:uncharacterized iron-regulated protein
MFLSPTGNKITLRAAAVFTRAAIAILLLVTGCTPTVLHGNSPGSDADQQDAAAHDPEPVQATPVLDLGAMPDLEAIIPRLAEQRVVFIGETHDRFDHHLTQLEIIRRLHAIHPRLAIGMEAFQQPFQGVLDDYIAGNQSEAEMLRATEYFTRWRFDYRLYAPILRYARAHRLPVIALNLPAELTRKVGREGVAALTAAERAQLPAEIDRSDTAYEGRLREVFNQHPDSGGGFENFRDVQLLWDEGMAERAVEYLVAHPDHHMVILAGSGHLARGSGIPRRLATESRALPPAGTLGVVLDDTGEVPTVESCLSDSPCTRAGLRRGDRFLSIDGESVDTMTDLRVSMWDRQPGDTVILRVTRKRWFSPTQELSYTIELY